MANGRYVLRGCVPDGDIDIANVRPGEIITRSWTFRVNEVDDTMLQEELDSGPLDPRNILRGYDGKLFDGDGNWLAEVNEWSIRVSVRNTDYQPAGSKVVLAIPQGFTVTLTFTETVLRDARTLAKVLGSLKAGSADAVLNFQGVLYGRQAA